MVSKDGKYGAEYKGETGEIFLRTMINCIKVNNKYVFEINKFSTHFSLSWTGGFGYYIIQTLQRNKKVSHLKLRSTGLVATEPGTLLRHSLQCLNSCS